MFEKIQQRLEQAAEDAKGAERDIREAFDDPLARQTEWSPAKRGGTKGRARRLERSSSERLTFKPTKRMLLFYAVPILAGAGVIVYQPLQNVEPAWVQTATGLVLLAMGLALGYRASTPVVLDRQLGMCWTGWRAPASAEQARDASSSAALADIRAVQVIPERLESTESTVSYEINLVRADGSRLNLVDHSALSVIREDAGALGTFLDVPVWDASTMAAMR